MFQHWYIIWARATLKFCDYRLATSDERFIFSILKLSSTVENTESQLAIVTSKNDTVIWRSAGFEPCHGSEKLELHLEFQGDLLVRCLFQRSFLRIFHSFRSFLFHENKLVLRYYLPLLCGPINLGFDCLF